jgi:hypothetical protein
MSETKETRLDAEAQFLSVKLVRKGGVQDGC